MWTDLKLYQNLNFRVNYLFNNGDKIDRDENVDNEREFHRMEGRGKKDVDLWEREGRKEGRGRVNASFRQIHWTGGNVAAAGARSVQTGQRVCVCVCVFVLL